MENIEPPQPCRLWHWALGASPLEWEKSWAGLPPPVKNISPRRAPNLYFWYLSSRLGNLSFCCSHSNSRISPNQISQPLLLKLYQVSWGTWISAQIQVEKLPLLLHLPPPCWQQGLPLLSWCRTSRFLEQNSCLSESKIYESESMLGKKEEA